MNTDPKAALALLPANMQQSLVATLCVTIAALLHEFSGGMVIVATTVPGILADNGLPVQVVVPAGDLAHVETMLPGIVDAIKRLVAHAAEQCQAQADARSAADRGN